MHFYASAWLSNGGVNSKSLSFNFFAKKAFQRLQKLPNVRSISSRNQMIFTNILEPKSFCAEIICCIIEAENQQK